MSKTSDNNKFGLALAKKVLKERGQFSYDKATQKETLFLAGMVKNHQANWKKGEDKRERLVQPTERMWKMLNNLGEV